MFSPVYQTCLGQNCCVSRRQFDSEQTTFLFSPVVQVLAAPAPTHHPTVIVPAPTLTQHSHHHITVVTKSPSVHTSTMSTSRQNLDTIVQVRLGPLGASAVCHVSGGEQLWTAAHFLRWCRYHHAPPHLLRSARCLVCFTCQLHEDPHQVGQEVTEKLHCG